MQYKIIAHLTPERLSEEVEELLNTGWKLHGNLILASHYETADESGESRTKTIYLQALINDQNPLENIATADEDDLVEAFA